MNTEEPCTTAVCRQVQTHHYQLGIKELIEVNTSERRGSESINSISFILTKWSINLRRTLMLKVHASEIILIFIHITHYSNWHWQIVPSVKDVTIEKKQPGISYMTVRS
jgi:hypothetical protein